ncbi:hypothetical protein SO802_005503 [Lithocarpus litseifolius]|uniref:Uncharacterized protein n=1 Tax=Lithocarpus litseifolius TaxID=425828 RepID=A0AAW2DIB7_9ROSI
MGGHSLVEISLKWLEGLSSGNKICKEVETITMEGLKVVHAQQGFIRCHFLVPSRLAEEVEIEAKVRADKNINICGGGGNSYICLRDPGSRSIPLDSILEHLDGRSLGIELSTFVSTKVLSSE